MCMFGGSSAPAPTTEQAAPVKTYTDYSVDPSTGLPSVAASVPAGQKLQESKTADTAAMAAANDARERRLRAGTASKTIATSSLGDQTEAATAKKTLLGA